MDAVPQDVLASVVACLVERESLVSSSQDPVASYDLILEMRDIARVRGVCRVWKRVTEKTMRPVLQTDACVRFFGQISIKRRDRKGEVPFRLLLRYHARDFLVAGLSRYRCARCGGRVASIGCNRHRCVRPRPATQVAVATGVLVVALALVLTRRATTA